MKLKYSLIVGGVDYTDRLISVSAIDTGVRDLGFGYVSDTSVECAYTDSLLDVVGQTVQIGLLLNGTSEVFTGTAEKVNVQGGEITISMRFRKPEELFKPRGKIYLSVYGKYVAVPVVYGNGICRARCLATKKAGDGQYMFLVGDNPNVSGVSLWSSQPQAYVILGRRTPMSGEIKWDTLSFEPNPLWDISMYDENTYLRVQYDGMNVYGANYDQGGNYSLTFIGYSPVFMPGGKYKWVRFENAGSGLTTQSMSLYIYPYDAPYRENEIYEGLPVTVNDDPSPANILLDIFSRNDIPASAEGSPLPIDLAFQADESFKEIAQKVAEQGLLYIIPEHNSVRIVPAVHASVSPIFTFTEAHIIPESMKIEKSVPSLNRVVVSYNRESAIYAFGSGTPEKTYKADYIVSSASAQTFASNYLAYHQKTTHVSFSTPLLPELFGVKAGNVVTLNYTLYKLNQNFQVVQKTIRKDRINWKCKEV